MTYNDDYDAQAKAVRRAEHAAGAETASHPGAQALQEKAATNAGFSHDKVAGVDLGASPLGTDAEAGGGAAAAGASAPTAASAGVSRDPNRANAIRPPAPWMWVIIAVLAAAVLAATLIMTVV
jgi:hypothetical protein